MPEFGRNRLIELRKYLRGKLGRNPRYLLAGPLDKGSSPVVLSITVVSLGQRGNPCPVLILRMRLGAQRRARSSKAVHMDARKPCNSALSAANKGPISIDGPCHGPRRETESDTNYRWI